MFFVGRRQLLRAPSDRRNRDPHYLRKPVFDWQPQFREVPSHLYSCRGTGVLRGKFSDIHPLRVMADACSLQLYCALEEWESGAYSAVDFEVNSYRDLYESVADVNIQSILDKPYLRGKLEAMWARIYGRGR
jgi:hypothetical protein